MGKPEPTNSLGSDEVPHGGDVSGEPCEDSALIADCLASHPEALRQLYDRFSRRIYALVYRIVGPQDVDDVCQSAFVQIYTKLGQFDGRSKLDTWIHRVATNQALQHLRREKKRTVRTLSEEPTVEVPDPAVANEGRTLLTRALSEMDDDLRTVLILKEQQGLAYAEIAKAMAIPEGTVGSRLNRARRELRQRLLRLGWNAQGQ